MANIDMIILSHGHFDHGDGLWNLSGGRILCHSGCFVKRYRKEDNSYIGLKNTKDELSGKFRLDTSIKPYKITDENTIYGIMGGFHLKEIDEQTKLSIRYLKNNRVKHVYPSHCTDLPSLSAFYENFKIKQVCSGDILKF